MVVDTKISMMGRSARYVKSVKSGGNAWDLKLIRRWGELEIKIRFFLNFSKNQNFFKFVFFFKAEL